MMNNFNDKMNELLNNMPKIKERNIPDTLDVFIVWSRDLKTSELIPLKLFTDRVDAKIYRDTIINDSHKLEDVIVVGYSHRHLFDEGYIL